MYVDLNPVRAAMTNSPEHSPHTSAFDRIGSLKGEQIESAAADLVVIEREAAADKLKNNTVEQLKAQRQLAKSNRGVQIFRDAWLAPLSIEEKADAVGAVAHGGARVRVIKVSCRWVWATIWNF